MRKLKIEEFRYKTQLRDRAYAVATTLHWDAFWKQVKQGMSDAKAAERMGFDRKTLYKRTPGKSGRQGDFIFGIATLLLRRSISTFEFPDAVEALPRTVLATLAIIRQCEFGSKSALPPTPMQIRAVQAGVFHPEICVYFKERLGTPSDRARVALDIADSIGEWDSDIPEAGRIRFIEHSLQEWLDPYCMLYHNLRTEWEVLLDGI